MKLEFDKYLKKSKINYSNIKIFEYLNNSVEIEIFQIKSDNFKSLPILKFKKNN